MYSISIEIITRQAERIFILGNSLRSQVPVSHDFTDIHLHELHILLCWTLPATHTVRKAGECWPFSPTVIFQAGLEIWAINKTAVAPGSRIGSPIAHVHHLIVL